MRMRNGNVKGVVADEVLDPPGLFVPVCTCVPVPDP